MLVKFKKVEERKKTLFSKTKKKKVNKKMIRGIDSLTSPRIFMINI